VLSERRVYLYDVESARSDFRYTGHFERRGALHKVEQTGATLSIVREERRRAHEVGSGTNPFKRPIAPPSFQWAMNAFASPEQCNPALPAYLLSLHLTPTTTREEEPALQATRAALP
jgi:hypothetical protein